MAGKELEFPKPGSGELPCTMHPPLLRERALETMRTLSRGQRRVSRRYQRDTRLPKQREEIKVEPGQGIEGKEGIKTFL